MDRLASVIQNSLFSHIAILDENGFIIAVNDAWADFARVNGAESTSGFIGVNYLDICRNQEKNDGTDWSGDDATRFLVGLRSLMNGEAHEFHMEYPCHSPTEQRWFRARITRLTMGSDRSPWFIVSHENITEQWQVKNEHRQMQTALAESEGRFRSALLAMQEGLVLHDQTGKISLCNPSSLEILELTEEELLGYTSQTSPWQSIHEDGTPWPGDTHPISISLSQGLPCHNAVMGIHMPDGRLKWILINSAPIFSPDGGDPIGAIATFVDVTRLKKEERERAERARRDHRIASVLQEAVIPSLPKNITPGLSVQALYCPASDEAVVGGDFYDVFPLAGGMVGLIVGDVIGHGLTAALSISRVRFALRGFLSEPPYPQPAEAFRRLNYFLYESNQLHREWDRDSITGPYHMLVALTLAVIDPRTGMLRLVTAGMEPSLIVRPQECRVDRLDATGMILGAAPDVTYEVIETSLASDDLLAITTDGITESFPRGGTKQFGIDGLGDALLRAAIQELSAQKHDNLRVLGDTVLATARAFAGGKFRDDICLLLARKEEIIDPYQALIGTA